MKIKTLHVNISLLVLILSLTVAGAINQSFKPHYKLETPKSSAGEITIVTPENKTYTEPDIGYYPATYGFENDLVGNDPYEWTVAEPGLQTVEVISSLDGHNNVLEFFDTESGAGAQALANNSFAPQTSGIIEFWYRTSGFQEHISIRGQEDNDIALYFGSEGGNFAFYNDSGWDIIAACNNDQWYHIKFVFDCTSDTYDFYLDGALILSNIDFYTTVSSLNKIVFVTRQWGTSSDFYCYVDALGYSWDTSYSIGDNLNEGLLLSYGSTTPLEWQGFSLDSQSNKTIWGNTTIPMPFDGLHTIQVFGNNSLGVMAESEIRYFTTNLMAPEISINSPIPNIITGTNPPEFDISILDTDLDTTWYSLDGGTTIIPFSGLIGMISQTEWDKIGNGTATITFYANDSVNNIGQAEVTIRKDIIAPVIAIISPTTAEEFEYTPIFDITIDEANLNEFWYTIDNGANNYTISSLTGSINQAAWDASSDGPVTIRFYARDGAGNIGTNSVIVAKIPSELPTPQPEIPGYNLIALIGVTLAVTLILAKRKFRSN